MPTWNSIQNFIFKNSSAPEWYWASGLHDALIYKVEELTLPYDYKLQDPDRNCFVLYIDGEGAIYDSDVTQIRLYNYEILTPDIQLRGRKKVWWISDRLTEADGGFVLEIDLQDLDAWPEDFTFKIRFGRAEVDRK